MAGFTYKSYNFVDKDPMIDQVRTIIQDSHMTYKVYLPKQVASPLTPYAIGWTAAPSKPQAATFNAVLRACGYKLTIRPIAEVEVISPTISMRHVVQIKKYIRGRA